MKDMGELAGADEKKIRSALLKKALGYNFKEVTEEYTGGEDGDIKLSKKRVVTKNVPPDMAAIKYLIEGKDSAPLSEMTDEQLHAEKERLVKLLTGAEKEKPKKGD